MNANGQTDISFINNDSVKFSFHFISPSLLDKHRIPSQHIVRVELSKEKRIKAKELKRADWMRLLNDTTSDWAANLILYDLFRKDATLYWGTDNISRFYWLYLFRKDDLKYWKRFLK
ncbi:MAG: signal recognition particle [Chitinophagaceae bacterium]|nr:signal recognition particle [Chitinophagaceae bacterium]